MVQDMAALLTGSVTSPFVVDELQRALDEVEERIEQAVTCTSADVEQVLRHLGRTKGKRFRPLLTVLSASLFSNELHRAVQVAAAAELIHMATLAHDDVIDGAELRRGKTTLNSMWENETAVLAGDVLLAKGLLLLVDAGDPRLVRIMSQMISSMCEGEIVQNVSLHDADQTEADYLARIEKKTAFFFAACCKAGALAAGASTEDGTVMFEFGRLLGMAFQIVDDLLDLSADQAILGKPVGNDLLEGVFTLPVIHALQQPILTATFRSILAKEDLSRSETSYLITLMQQNGCIEYAKAAALSYVRQAERSLLRLQPRAEAQDYLSAVSKLVVDRVC